MACDPQTTVHCTMIFRFCVRSIQEATTDPITPTKDNNVGQSQSSTNWKVKMLYDGDCPLCMREAMGKIHAIMSDGTIVTNVENPNTMMNILFGDNIFDNLCHGAFSKEPYSSPKHVIDQFATIASAVLWVGAAPLEEVLERFNNALTKEVGNMLRIGNSPYWSP
ncbi:hypothetical protein Tco_0840793 [Tanacetum coccineum]|uniref:DUF393 domain-containing protein n=1 Tax=Tanacetum coccineum TaxID=301880 RepID=A0ABQ5AYX1_9ASTR